jgi:hypothetical protein
MKIFEVVSVGNNVFHFSVLEHIKANRRNIEVELKEHLKLCRWERSENLLSIENSKRTRHKLRKLIQKYTVSNMHSSFGSHISLFANCNVWIPHYGQLCRDSRDLLK